MDYPAPQPDLQPIVIYDDLIHYLAHDASLVSIVRLAAGHVLLDAVEPVEDLSTPGGISLELRRACKSAIRWL